MEKRKKIISAVTLCVSIALLVSLSIIPVASADTITETNGYYQFKMSRFLVPITYRYEAVAGAYDYNLGIASLAFTFTDTDYNGRVALSTYFYTGLAGYDVHVGPSSPIRQDFDQATNDLTYIRFNVGAAIEGANAEQYSFRYAIYVQEGYFNNVAYIERGNVWDSNISDIVGPAVFQNVNTNLVKWSYLKLTAVNGQSLFVFFEIGPHINNTQGNLAIASTSTYQRYYLNYDINEQSYAEGKIDGSNEGVSVGKNQADQTLKDTYFQKGYDQAVEDGVADYSTLAGWANAVLSMLDVKLFGFFSLGDVLVVIAGFSIAMFVLNMVKR